MKSYSSIFALIDRGIEKSRELCELNQEIGIPMRVALEKTKLQVAETAVMRIYCRSLMLSLVKEVAAMGEFERHTYLT